MHSGNDVLRIFLDEQPGFESKTRRIPGFAPKTDQRIAMGPNEVAKR